MKTIFLMLALSLCAFGYNEITHEYGYYKDTKSGKVFRMFCNIDSGYFEEQQAINKGGMYVPNSEADRLEYSSGSCSFVKQKLDMFVKQGKLRRVQ